MSNATLLLDAIERGDCTAADELLPLVYNQLRRLAAAKIAQEGDDISLQGTALVHEAYLRLLGSRDEQTWNSRGHFFSAAAEAMRRILVERARKKQCLKRGAGWRRLDQSDIAAKTPDDPDELLALNDALSLLESHDIQAYQLVKLRYFGGLNHQEAAAALGISRRGADRIWAIARVWLHERLRAERPSKPR